MNSNIYNIDFGLAAERLSPPDKRTPVYLRWLHSLLSPLQWLRNFIFTNYAQGNTSSYDEAVSYVYGDVVKYNRFVYMNISIDGSTGINPSSSTTWLHLSDTDIGLRERLRYNGQTMVLQAVLNKIITGDPEPTPRITISNISNDKLETYFYNQSDSSNFTRTPRFYKQHTAPSTPVYLSMEEEYSEGIDFRINVPALYYWIDPEDPEEENKENLTLLTTYVEKYKLIGTKYKIEEE